MIEPPMRTVCSLPAPLVVFFQREAEPVVTGYECPTINELEVGIHPSQNIYPVA